jgi:histidine triad (HIT) family protein
MSTPPGPATPPTESDCPFCAIVAGRAPATVVADAERVLAFTDIAPQAPTHVLVVSRAHHPTVAELARHDPAALVELVTVADQVATQAELPGYRLVFNTGTAAQQSVHHVHGHVLGGRPFSWPPG